MDIIMQHCVSRGRRKNDGEMISKNKYITWCAFSHFKMFPNGPSAFFKRKSVFGKELSLTFFTGLNSLELFFKCLLLLFPSPFLFPCRNSKFETRGGFAICGKCVVVRFSFSAAAKMAIYPCSIVGKTFRTRGCCRRERRTSWNGEMTFFLFSLLIFIRIKLPLDYLLIQNI